MPDSSHHSDKIRRMVEARDNVSMLVSSWRRSLFLHKLDPDERQAPRRLDPEATIAAQKRSAGLIEAANQTLDHLFGLLDDKAYCVLLSDANGTVLTVRTTSTHDFWNRTSDQWTGTDLSEQSEGTNGTGTALIERRAIAIQEGDHFYARNAHILCSGAPIFGSDGAVIGSIDVTRRFGGESEIRGKLIMFAVVEASRRIELAYFRAAFPQARVVLVPGAPPVALLALTSNDRVVGATYAARQFLGLTVKQMETPFPVGKIWPSPATETEGTLSQIERRAIAQALTRHGDNVSAAAKSLGISRGTLHRKRIQWNL